MYILMYIITQFYVKVNPYIKKTIGITLDFITSLLMMHTLIAQYTRQDNLSSFAF